MSLNVHSPLSSRKAHYFERAHFHHYLQTCQLTLDRYNTTTSQTAFPFIIHYLYTMNFIEADAVDDARFEHRVDVDPWIAVVSDNEEEAADDDGDDDAEEEANRSFDWAVPRWGEQCEEASNVFEGHVLEFDDCAGGIQRRSDRKRKRDGDNTGHSKIGIEKRECQEDSAALDAACAEEREQADRFNVSESVRNQMREMAIAGWERRMREKMAEQLEARRVAW